MCRPTAAALLGAAALHPVALDPDDAERPTSESLTTLEQIWRHFRNRRDDGCGLQLGVQRAGVVLVALHGDAAQWRIGSLTCSPT